MYFTLTGYNFASKQPHELLKVYKIGSHLLHGQTGMRNKTTPEITSQTVLQSSSDSNFLQCKAVSDVISGTAQCPPPAQLLDKQQQFFLSYHMLLGLLEAKSQQITS